MTATDTNASPLTANTSPSITVACPAVSDATPVSVAAGAASGKPTVYWSSPANSVLILRMPDASVTDVPTVGTTYTVGAQPWGASKPTVAYNGVS